MWSFLKEASYKSLRAGGLITFNIGCTSYYMITDPEDCFTIANTCLHKTADYDFAKPWIGEGLLTSSGNTWRMHRKLLNPAFSPVVVRGFQDIFNKQSRRLVTRLEAEVGKGPFDHRTYTRECAIETICFTIMGVNITGKTDITNEYVNAAEEMMRILAIRLQTWWLRNNFIYNWLPLKKKQDKYLKILHNISNNVLNKRKADYMNNRRYDNVKEKTKGPKFVPFMDLLLEISAQNGAFSDVEIKQHIDTMIVAGYDTSATMLLFSMLLIGSYPQVQQKICEELHAVYGDDDRDVTNQDLSRLVYLEAVIKECLRFCPIIPLIAKFLDKDVKIRDWTLKRGARCVMLIYGIHRHPMWGPDAEQFKPERWLDRATLPECPHAFAGFSMGRRICIGQSYVYMSLKTTLSHLFRHYRVFGDYAKVVAKYDIVLKPVSGHHISIERRKT